MNDFKPNSHRFKEEQKAQAVAETKRVEKVISGNAKVKKNEVRRFADIFISEDVKNVKSYVLMDVLVPAIKKAISDIVTNGIDMILYGESGRPKKSGSSFVSYDSSYRRSDERRHESAPARTSYRYNDIVLDTRSEAEEVLNHMDDIIETYGVVRVADFYDLCGVTGNFTDNSYGWSNISTAKIEHTRDGFVIKMPRAMPIQK